MAKHKIGDRFLTNGYRPNVECIIYKIDERNKTYWLELLDNLSDRFPKGYRWPNGFDDLDGRIPVNKSIKKNHLPGWF